MGIRFVDGSTSGQLGDAPKRRSRRSSGRRVLPDGSSALGADGPSSVVIDSATGLQTFRRTRSGAYEIGAALEAARAEERRYAEGGNQGELDFKGLPLLRAANKVLGPRVRLDQLVPSLRTVGARVTVLEDRETRNSLFRDWFRKYDIECHVTLRGAIERLAEQKSHYLFLDFDIHDVSDRTLRKWLRIPEGRKEVDGLDLAEYVTARLPPEKLPDCVIVHSRNPVGRELMFEHLRKRKQHTVLWTFDYDWTGFDGQTKPAKTTATQKLARATPAPTPAPTYAQAFRASTGRYHNGLRVKFTGVFLKNTGQQVGGEGQKVFVVQPCGCDGCTDGHLIAVDEKSDFDPSLQRHIATNNVFAEGELTIRNDP